MDIFPTKCCNIEYIRRALEIEDLLEESSLFLFGPRHPISGMSFRRKRFSQLLSLTGYETEWSSDCGAINKIELHGRDRSVNNTARKTKAVIVSAIICINADVLLFLSAFLLFGKNSESPTIMSCQHVCLSLIPEFYFIN